MFKKFLQNTRKPQGASGHMMAKMMNKGHARVSSWGFSHISPSKGWHMLDIGCGGGANLSAFLSLCPDGYATGIDYSPVCVAESAKYNQKAVQEGKCRVLQGDASHIPFEDSSFHLVTAFETIYFWPDLPSSFQQIFRILKPGGVFLICNEDSDPENDRWTSVVEGMKIYGPEQLKDMLKKAGFVNIRQDIQGDWLCITAEKSE